MYKVGICGHFAFGRNFLDGQTVKTKTVACELDKLLGESNVLKVDTHGGLKKTPQLILRLISMLRSCENIIILPAQNGLKMIAPILSVLNRFYKKNLYYIVIGGWLKNIINRNFAVRYALQSFDGIFVETATMRKALNDLGYSNVKLFPNCKNIEILGKEELIFNKQFPLKICTFSRVVKEKGIEDLVNAVEEINEESGKIVYTLDIYGQVADDYSERFSHIVDTLPEYIKYCGAVDFDKSVEVLKKYFALIFPTKFYTEGIPGTIIDAYAAGVPVIASKWESFDDIVTDGVTGLGYEFDNLQDLKEKLVFALENIDLINSMKESCLEMAQKYLASNVVRDFCYTEIKSGDKN